MKHRVCCYSDSEKYCFICDKKLKKKSSKYARHEIRNYILHEAGISQFRDNGGML